MKLKVAVFGIIIGLFCNKAFSEEQNGLFLPPVMKFHVGMLSSSFTENEDSIETTDGTLGNQSAAYSGSASTIAFEAQFENFLSYKRSYYIRGAGTLLGGESKFYGGNIGMNYYFGDQIASNGQIEAKGFKMQVRPMMRYYAGGGVGVDYLVYNTKSQTKGDFLLDIGLHGGVIYPLNPKWALSGEGGFSRQVGTLVSSTQIRIMFGVVATIESFK